MHVACTCIHDTGDRTLEDAEVRRHRERWVGGGCVNIWVPRGLGAPECGQELGLVGRRSRDKGQQRGNSSRGIGPIC